MSRKHGVRFKSQVVRKFSKERNFHAPHQGDRKLELVVAQPGDSGSVECIFAASSSGAKKGREIGSKVIRTSIRSA